MNKVCIVGCRSLTFQPRGRCRLGDETFTEGDLLSLDGHSGRIYAGEMEVVVGRPTELLARVAEMRRVAAAARCDRHPGTRRVGPFSDATQ